MYPTMHTRIGLDNYFYNNLYSVSGLAPSALGFRVSTPGNILPYSKVIRRICSDRFSLAISSDGWGMGANGSSRGR